MDEQPIASEAPAFRRSAVGLLEAVGASGNIYAQSIDTGRCVELDADTPVVTASVFKIAVLLELHRQADLGQLRLDEPVEVTAADRVFGPTGLSCFTDAVCISLRDLAVLMISISDNTATDVLLRCVGLQNVNRTLRSLGLPQTELTGTCAQLLASLIADIDLGTDDDPAQVVVDPARLQAARALRAQTTSRSTAHEMTSLLVQIWNDEAASAESCVRIRNTLALQAWAHGLRAGLQPSMSFAGKSGTLPGVRNEAGVITTSGGERIALAVFIRYRTSRLVEQRADIDAAMADLGGLVIRALAEDGA